MVMLSLASSFTDGVGVCEKLFHANKRKHFKSHACFKGLQSQGNFVMEPPRLCPLLLLLNSTWSCTHLFHHYYKLINSSPWRRTQWSTHAMQVKPWGVGSGDTWALWSLSAMHRFLPIMLCPLCHPFPHQPHHLPSAGMAPSVAGSKVSSQHWQKLLLVSPRLSLHSIHSWQGSCMRSTGLPGDAPASMPEGAVESLNAKQLLIFKVNVIYCQNKGWTVTLFEDNKLPLHSKILLGYHWGIWKTYCCTENTVLHSSSLFCIN